MELGDRNDKHITPKPFRLVPYLSHGLFMGFGPKTGVAYVSHFWQKACGLNMVFGKT